MRWPTNFTHISNGFSASHTANDLAAPEGREIVAPTNGAIDGVNRNPAAYFGGMFIILIGDDGYRYYMGHCSQVDVKTGQRVTEGQKIGNVGMTGQATGPHIHFEMSKGGVSLDPSKLIGKTQGEDEVIQDNDSSYDRWLLATRRLRGGEAAERFTRDVFNSVFVGQTTETMLDKLMHDPEADYRERAGDVGNLAIQGDWWNRLVAKPQVSGASSEDIDKAVKEAQEALEAVTKLKK